MPAAKKLYRSNDSVFAGVCAGFAEYLDIDPVIVRILATFLALATGGIVLIAYIALWAILPRQATEDPGAIPCAAYVPTRQEPGFQGEAYGPYSQQPQQPGWDAAASPASADQPPCEPQWQVVPQSAEVPTDPNALSAGAKAGVLVGLILLSVGIAGFLGTVIVDVMWWQLWPAFFLLGGLMLMLVPSRHMPFLTRFSLGISIVATNVVFLAASVGVLSWATVTLALASLWPVLIIAAGLVVIGSALHNRLFGLAAAACVVVCCVAALTVYAVPGYLDLVTLSVPFADPHMLDPNPWN